ncbi:MAG: cupin domain-containing protein [Acidobacteria bacterium]|nr:cupin domain-containing protein [Acidobacteriota bacterium]MCB9397517.1 cupin domain-containing protein [Acidobacteriota bacterium]
MTDWVQQLGLVPHPEGGFYKETYRAELQLPVPWDTKRTRSAGTGIYYLLKANDFSCWHRIRSDEGWHFYAGQTLEIHVLDSDGYRVLRLGIEAEAYPQHWVPARSWFAARLADPHPDHFALVGCTVAPGFDFADFEMANASLLDQFPEHSADIRPLLKKRA